MILHPLPPPCTPLLGMQMVPPRPQNNRLQYLWTEAETMSYHDSFAATAPTTWSHAWQPCTPGMHDARQLWPYPRGADYTQ